MGGWVVRKMSIGPRPETFPEATADRFDERLIGMSGEELFEDVDFNGSDDGEEVRIFTDSLRDNRVVEFSVILA
ncbi:hypothetical protein Hypma_007375 [Hypsizygus marmoreus]|uniref:Uncharacterized protein n=1 Tax=Hypsizygus marmoreus TaxID=39966 RepID=A0A369JSI3_HYPMA|nr:hypothetical protein Hypma_007375 [Hypsizygus marmoreus]